MFRQRLKGGHRVGSTSNQPVYQPPNVNVASPAPSFQTPNTDTVHYAPFNPNGDGSWHIASTDSTWHSGSNYQYHDVPSQGAPKQTRSREATPQLQNGANSQNQANDDWSWGNDDNWNDWGNNTDMSLYNVNNNFSTSQSQSNHPQQSFNTGQKNSFYRPEGQNHSYISSGQQNIVAPSHHRVAPSFNNTENANMFSSVEDPYLNKDSAPPSIRSTENVNTNMFSSVEDPYLNKDSAPPSIRSTENVNTNMFSSVEDPYLNKDSVPPSIRSTENVNTNMFSSVEDPYLNKDSVPPSIRSTENVNTNMFSSVEDPYLNKDGVPPSIRSTENVNTTMFFSVEDPYLNKDGVPPSIRSTENVNTTMFSSVEDPYMNKDSVPPSIRSTENINTTMFSSVEDPYMNEDSVPPSIRSTENINTTMFSSVEDSHLNKEVSQLLIDSEVAQPAEEYKADNNDFQQQLEINAQSAIKSDDNFISDNLTYMQLHDTYHHDRNSHIDSYNSPSTETENSSTTNDGQVSSMYSNQQTVNPNAITEEGRIAFVCDSYAKHPQDVYSEDDKFNYEPLQQEENVCDSKSYNWDGVIMTEASSSDDKAQGNQGTTLMSKNEEPINHFSEEQLVSNFERINLVSAFVPANDSAAIDQVSADIDPNDSSPQPVASWDDEWGDGWELKPQDSQSMDPASQHYSATDALAFCDAANFSNEYQYDNTPYVLKSDQDVELVNLVRESSKSESVSEVADIQALNQELQGIFSGPTEAALVVNTDSCETYEQKYASSYILQENNLDVKEILQTDIPIHIDHREMDPEDINKDEENFANSSTIVKHEDMSEISDVNIVHKQIFPASDEVSVSQSETRESPLSNVPYTITDNSIKPNEIEDHENKLIDGIGNSTNNAVISSTPPIGPSGSFPNLHARKGSPFQPPTSRRSIVPQQQLYVASNNRSSEPFLSGFQDQVSIEGNPILSNFQPPEQNIKLCVIERPSQLESKTENNENTTQFQNILMSLPEAVQNETLICNRPSDIPPAAHLHSLQSAYETPKVRTLESLSDTPASPSVLDLSHFTIKREERDPPDFKRMIPGESSKEKSMASSYQLPVIVPSMPSGRVVTGNANPQPVPSVRIKHEPSEIRAPPDGPDTGAIRDESPGVVPPIRSETIGSEDHEVRIPRSDRRDDDRHSEREREKETRRDFYSGQNEGGYYANDSSQRSKPRDRNYDPYYGERRYGRRTLYDDPDDEGHDEDNNDERKFAEGIQERRRRAYRDELERYGERDRDTQLEKRRHKNREHRYNHQEDESLYYDDQQSDRSRPSSRSSSFGNELETGPGSHSSHIDEYYDRVSKGRERYRDKNARDPYRDYTQYKRRECKERDPYARAFNPYVDQRYGSRDMYDPSYYYYMQNYQKYFDHPFYREYYRQYFGRYGFPSGEPPVDDKASTRSGRSSVNEEMKKSSLSSHYTHDFVDRSSVSAYESSFYPEQFSFNGRSLASNDVSRVPSVTDEPTPETQHRMSPHFYTGPHLRATFTSGGKLLLVLPNDPKEGEKATVQLRNVQKMLAVDSAFDLRIKKLAFHPGPVTIKETHKDVVLRFCEEQAIHAVKNDSLYDKESVVLMWNYLLLLVKQNGNVCGADFAGLLLKGKSTRSDTPAAGEHSAVSGGSDLHDGIKEEPKIAGQVESITSRDETELIKNFTELLCLGRKREAVDFAIREKLWGYAMMLAAKMDSITHARVTAAFMQTIPSTDVLQTLMQHLSGKKPEVTRNYNAERWGDWRLHLAAMVSNPTGNAQKDHASIISLGDTLASKHRYHAAHLCYLAAEAEWGTYSNKDSKLVLLGSSPNQPFQVFASDDAIQCTEIYEFAKSLDANNPLFYRFQSYKLIYGYRLAEFGFPNEALRYCQVITEAVLKQPTLFHIDFVAKLLKLASQLKYYDVHYQLGEGEVYDMADPEWLQYLNHALQTLEYKASEELTQKSAAEAVEREAEAYTAPESDSKITSRRNSDLMRTVSRNSDYANHTHQETFDRPTEQPSYVENSMQSNYARNGPYYDNGASSHIDSKEVVDGCSSQSYHGMHSISTAEPQPEFVDDSRMATSYSSPGELYTQQVSNEVDSSAAHAPILPESSNQQIPWQPEYPGSNHYQVPDSNQVCQSDPVHQLSQQYSERSPDPLPHEEVDHPAQTPKMSAEEEEYWKMMTGKLQTVPEQCSITSRKKVTEPDDQRVLGLSGQSVTTSHCTEVKEKKESNETAKNLDDSAGNSIKKEESKSANDKNDLKDDDKKSAGFLGSLFGGWRKGNNQAKLPDDKNPTIVWDETKKKWVNKDGDENDDVAPPPPPSTFAGQPPPILRGVIKKSRYVDPVGDKGKTKAPVQTNLPPLPTMGSLPAPKITSPEMPVDGIRETQQFGGSSETAFHSVPPMQDNLSMIQRDRYASSSSSVDLYDEPGSDSVQGTTTSNEIPMMNPVEPQQQPLFFNPAQFQVPQGVPPKPAKRTGPAKRSYNPQR